MPTIYDGNARGEIARRFERLGADSKPGWGQMNAPRMLQHVTDGLRMAMGELVTKPKDTPFRFRPIRWMVIHGPLPWPKGAPTAPELLAPPSGNWDELQGRFRETLNRIPEEMTAEHPAFGKLSSRDWGVLVWRHLDHHLRQFGL